jgi:hypothetical protein
MGRSQIGTEKRLSDPTDEGRAPIDIALIRVVAAVCTKGRTEAEVGIEREIRGGIRRNRDTDRGVETDIGPDLPVVMVTETIVNPDLVVGKGIEVGIGGIVREIEVVLMIGRLVGKILVITIRKNTETMYHRLVLRKKSDKKTQIGRMSIKVVTIISLRNLKKGGKYRQILCRIRVPNLSKV